MTYIPDRKNREFSTDAGGRNRVSQLDDNYLAAIGMGIDNTPDELVLAYMPITVNQSVYGIITIKES